MTQFFRYSITAILAISASLLIVFTTSVLLLGVDNTERSLKALFQIDNYTQSYQTIEQQAGKKNTFVQNATQHSSFISYAPRKNPETTKLPPFIVPSSGIAPRSAFLYTGPLKDGGHEGIDIWTNTRGTGMNPSSYGKGNPVYAACDGTVRTVWEENGDVSIICDPIDPIYKDVLPSLEIKTLYGHMADQFSSDVYIYVQEGQQVKQGQLIGHQGNRCFWAPHNRVVHLHFGVYDIHTQPQVPLDPEPYIGVSCTTLHQEYVAGNNN